MKTWPVDVSGVSPEFGRMRNLIPDEGGRFIDPVDMREQRRVIFMGDKMAANVFGKAAAAVGKTVMLGNSPFLVVGTLRTKIQDSSYSGRDNDKAFIPGTTYLALTGEKYVNNVIYQASSSFEKRSTIRMRPVSKTSRVSPSRLTAMSSRCSKLFNTRSNSCSVRPAMNARNPR